MNGQYKYDLEERTLKFAIDVRRFLKKLPYNIQNHEDGKQLIRCSGSVGSNYIEANDAFSNKDLLFRLKLCRKEAKECSFFLRIFKEFNKPFVDEAVKLNQEAVELKKIFSAIINKRK